MSSSTATALLLGIPSGILCAIDLLSFTTSPSFQGIKDIPPGWHFIFTSETSSLSIRDGFWVHVEITSSSTQSMLIVREWDSSTGSLRSSRDSEDHRGQLAQSQEKSLWPYQQSSNKDGTYNYGDWEGLTRYITPRILSNLTQNDQWRITSASSAKQDRDDIPGLTHEEVGEEGELGILGIDLKQTWRKGATGRERTEAALDRTWALGDVLERWQKSYPDLEPGWENGDVVLGQMQACFLMVLTVSNFSCLEEWKRIVGLVLTCKRALKQRAAWFVSFLDLLQRQLKRCDDVEGGLFDMSYEGSGQLKQWLNGFKTTVHQIFEDGEGEDIKEELDSIELFLKDRYGWELGSDFVRKGMLELEDGEQVYMEMEEMEGEDESGDYAPVIVDIEES